MPLQLATRTSYTGDKVGRVQGREVAEAAEQFNTGNWHESAGFDTGKWHDSSDNSTTGVKDNAGDAAGAQVVDKVQEPTRTCQLFLRQQTQKGREDPIHHSELAQW